MTQKEKLIKAFLAMKRIKHSAERLEEEAKDYDVKFCRSYSEDIISMCDEIARILDK